MRGLEEAGKVLLQRHGLIKGGALSSPSGGAAGGDAEGAESGKRLSAADKGRQVRNTQTTHTPKSSSSTDPFIVPSP